MMRTAVTILLTLALVPLMTIGCEFGIGMQPAPTPLPPATPLLPGPSDPLAKLVANSTAIVIGTLTHDEPESVRAQDRSNASVQSVGSSFNVQVERYLKGSGGDTIPVVQFTGLDFRDRGQTRQVRDEKENLLMDEGSRYLLFLKENENYPGLPERNYSSLQVPIGGRRSESGKSRGELWTASFRIVRRVSSLTRSKP